MARSRRKAGGPRRGKFKHKKLGKGWSTFRRTPRPPPPAPGPADKQTG